ncbi:ATP-dependent protease subunit HslV [Ruminobacter sp. RM87]|uniref:ATP-dependent protease subunit HslV n=1 Tax=Ruminobacter sp. RM87 TaxID=1200567 RepID=UPI0004E13548|nr:ATP-dependent protease subunit HslV [Ruminobacter sp. RM87]
MTTIVSVRKNGKVVIGGDGQVSLGNTVLKGNARKVRKLNNGDIIVGFAGSTADAFTLLDIFEEQVKSCNGNFEKSVIAFSKLWRTDKILRRLEAMIIVADKSKSFLISGSGDVVTQDNDLLAIGSGGNYAYSAARALLENTELDAEEIVKKSLDIASDICVFTNKQFTIESIAI